MRSVKYHVAVTLDGFLAHADGSFEGFTMAGDHADEYLASLASYGAVLMGRRTYEAGLKCGVTDPYPALDSYVFSRTLQKSPSPRVQIIADDAATVVQRLKQQAGRDLYLCGGGELASTLFAAGLIDEVLLKVNPVLLGAGIAIAPRLGHRVALDLLSTKVYKNGVLLLRYAVLPSTPH